MGLGTTSSSWWQTAQAPLKPAHEAGTLPHGSHLERFYRGIGSPPARRAEAQVGF
jgi:hypothetical protein